MINAECQDTNIQRNSSSEEGSRSQEIMCTSPAESLYTDESNEVLAKAMGSGAHSYYKCGDCCSPKNIVLNLLNLKTSQLFIEHK